MRIPSFDYAKFICAFLVVCIHLRFPKYGEHVLAIARSAVPMFLCISGYFLYNHGWNTQRLKSSAIKIARTTFACSLFYLAYHIVDSYFTSGQVIINFKIGYVMRGLIFNNSLDFLSGHLWYMLAFIYTLIVMIGVVKWKLSTKAFYAIPLLLTFLLIYDYIYSSKAEDIIITRNFLFTGIPFFLLGSYLKKNKAHIQEWKISMPILVTCLIVAMSLCVVECIITGIHEIYTSNILVVVIAMIICIRLKEHHINRHIEKIGREHSLNIYLYHMFMRRYILNLSTAFNISIISPILLFIATYIFSISLKFLLRKTIPTLIHQYIKH